LAWLFFLISFFNIELIENRALICFLFASYEVITASWLRSWILYVNLGWSESIQYVIISISFLKRCRFEVYFSQTMFFFFLGYPSHFCTFQVDRVISGQFLHNLIFFLLENTLAISKFFLTFKNFNLTRNITHVNDLVLSIDIISLLSSHLFICWSY